MNLVENIKAEILSHTVSEKQRKIGLEVEGFYYDRDFNRLPVNPTNQYSATDLFQEVLQKRQSNDMFTYSLEPGGQLEWASAPTIRLWDIQKQFDQHVEIENQICESNQIDRLHLSLEPLCVPNDIDLITLNKYQLMHDLFSQTGRLGPWMMRNTTSVQLNIDYTSEQDANEMAFLADAIQPLFSILFSNSPFIRGEPVGTTNMRWKIWEDTDPERCRSLFDHGIFSAQNMVNDYAKWLPEIKTIFKYNTNGEAESFNGTLGEMIISEPKAVQQHILTALHQSFTHVRFKNFLEIRASDRPPKGMEMAPAAFLAGLLTAPNTRSEALNVVLGWSKKERNELIATAHDLSYDQSGPENKPIGDWLSFFSNLSLQGLGEREKLLKIKNETPLVRPFLENVLSNGPKTIQVQNEFQKMDLSVQAFLKDYCLDSTS